MANHPNRSRLPRGFSPEDSVDALPVESDQYYSGCGHRSLSTADLGRYQVEFYRTAEGERTVTIYSQAAMQRAAARSVKAGGGVRGLNSDHLRSGESRRLPDDCSIGRALDIARGLR